ncbi:class I poly(R)-hydroxyalkanoic acid synthase [Mesobaculum littorinae]|uniref:Class I poly(R)-hydroxyalkanoic acid synthase n=1 Tax=Mesobaculum littorinae TaxID=2486419 RepID=A0A438AKI1_9RHOB|nr:class I poly(R)-hydroxyalkanoic acid synthase [Mesobaculum littorinae]RVV99218.1 class I poly(R)-hydroxyalkanoic acid synthase [Mesobaculum littorinae]
MTTHDETPPQEIDTLTRNLGRIEELSGRLMTALSQRRPVRSSLQGPSPDLYARAATAWWAEAMANPAKIMEHQVGYWGRTLKHYAEAQQSLTRGPLSAPEDPGPKDRRFADPMWDTHPYFNWIKQQYQINAQAVRDAVADLDGLAEGDRQRLAYFSQQILDMLSPTNFLATNPTALSRALETEGQSLVDGLENLVRDIEANDGELLVTLSDPQAFQVGGNLATSEGSVVFRNDLFELIQYAPRTEQVHRTPLVIFTPWINKFYILDLRERNSLIRWITEQDFTLFVVSWKNPDASYRDVGMDDYVERGFLQAIASVKQITGEDQVNAVGYCIAGTTLALTLALMARRGDRSVKSATFFTTLTDFSDPGEVGAFLDDDFVDGIEADCQEKGVLHSVFMNRTFSFLRANDLVYAPAIRSYMLGEAPPAFDLLYWNGDSTNLPARMAVEYLRGLCQQDRFATTGFEILGETVRLSDVTQPLCAIACEADHIAAWRSSFRGMAQTGSRSKTFFLTQAGHVAGIVNPPSKKKYGHWTHGDWSGGAEAWKEAAEFHEGSWWPRWGDWLSRRSGRKIPARVPGEDGVEVLGPAPGTYVTEQPNA